MSVAMDRLNHAYDLLASKKHMPETVIEDDIDVCRNAMAAAERECDQLRAERDQALTLLREMTRVLGDGMRYQRHETAVVMALGKAQRSGLLDDEGQQQ